MYFHSKSKMGFSAIICTMLHLIGFWGLEAGAEMFIPKRQYIFNVTKSDNSKITLPNIYVMRNSYLQCSISNLSVAISPNFPGLSAVPNWQNASISLVAYKSDVDWPESLEFELRILCNVDSVQEHRYYQPLLKSNIKIHFVRHESGLDGKALCSQYEHLKYDIMENSAVGIVDDLFKFRTSNSGNGAHVLLDIEQDATDYFTLSSGVLSLIKPLDRESDLIIQRFSITCTLRDQIQRTHRHTVYVQVQVFDTDDNLPSNTNSRRDPRKISFKTSESRRIDVHAVDADSADITMADTYRITTDDTMNIVEIVKSNFRKIQKRTLITTELRFTIPSNHMLPLELQVIFEDLNYSPPGQRLGETKKVIYHIELVNESDPPVKKWHRQKIDLSKAAANYSLIAILGYDDTSLSNKTRWELEKFVPPSRAGIIDITDTGEVYLKNAKRLSYPGFPHLEVTAVKYNDDKKAEEFPISVMITAGEGILDEKDKFIACDHSCFKFKSEHKCNSSCGYGSLTGRCLWYLNFDDNQSTTCTPNTLHCPDGICSKLEQMNSSICPQDCLRGHKPERRHPKYHSRPQFTPPCWCSGQVEDDCACHKKQPSTLSLTTQIAIIQPNAHTVVNNDDEVGNNSQPACSDTCRAGIAAALAVVVSAVILIILMRMAWKRRQRNKPPALKHVGSTVSMAAIPSDYIMDDSREQRSHVIRPSPYPVTGQWISKIGLNQEIDDKWEFPRNQLTLDNVIGEGEFGQVVRAEAKGMNGNPDTTIVAIKMLKSDASGAEYQDLISEFNMLKEVDHPNVIRLLGVCTQQGPLYVIVEYCELGSLRSFLRTSKFKGKVGWDEKQRHLEDSLTSQECRVLSVRNFFTFAWQIAKGMEYLAGLKIVHRDLAARNVLVTKTLLVKISDFGLSRDVYEADTYLKMSKGRIPVKWMAPESLYAQIYTTKSDIWSYGIVLWEIATLGASPYPGIPPERLFPLLSTGYRMDRPEECPDEFYAIMQKCWKYAPEDRPSFSTLRTILDHLLQQKTEYLALSSDVRFSLDEMSYGSEEDGSNGQQTLKSVNDQNNHARYNNIPPTSPAKTEPYVVAQWQCDDDSDNECPESSHLLSTVKQDVCSQPDTQGHEDIIQQKTCIQNAHNKNQRVMVHENLTYV